MGGGRKVVGGWERKIREVRQKKKDIAGVMLQKKMKWG